MYNTMIKKIYNPCYINTMSSLNINKWDTHKNQKYKTQLTPTARFVGSLTTRWPLPTSPQPRVHMMITWKAVCTEPLLCRVLF